FGITVTGLTAGDWTLTLDALTSTSVTRRVTPAVVPDPGTLLLLGSGLAALGLLSRRKRKVSAIG
ncbi:MAG TPA: PEP-CTERM sorting domain-containing protein, partial [Nitrococcus sp.]|nr:PEP-CTERM sorting domain-containing protein [Nitrococcus sp.]